MEELTVASAMTVKVVTATPETPVKELVALMRAQRVRGVPVVDKAGRPVGVVPDTEVLVGRGWRRPWGRLSGRTAGETMVAPAICVRADATITTAVRFLVARNTRGLCVVDSDGVLVGVLARHDVIGMFLRADVRDAQDTQGAPAV